MKWQKLGSAKLFEHPRLSLYEDEVQLPSGKQTKYLHFGEATDAATIIAIGTDGMVFVQKEYSYPPDEILYQFPGGALDENEAPTVGAAREFAEEAGMSGDLRKIGWYYTNNRRSRQKMHVYIATNLQPAEAPKDEEELFEDFWFSEMQVDQLLRDGKITNYTFLAAWLIYKSTK